MSSGDTLTGTGTTPTLNVQLTDVGVALTTSATITGVTNLNVTNLGSATDVLAGGNITGLTTINNTASAAGVSFGSAASALNTAVTNLNITNATSGTVTSVFVANAALTGTTDAIAITLNGDTNSGVITVASASGTNGYEVANITVSGTGNNVISGFTNGATNTSLTTVNLLGGTTGATLNIGALDATVATINAAGTTAFAGNLILGAATSLALTATARAITGGAGNDKVYVSNLGSAYTINGGAGTNSLVLTSTAGAATAATITNIQTIELAGTATNVAAGTGNGGTGFGVTSAAFLLSGATGVTTLQLDGATTGNTGTVTLTNLPTTASALAVNLVGTGVAQAQTFNGLTFAGLTAGALTETISNQGVSVGTAAITVGAQNLTGITSANIAITNTGANVTTFTTGITDANLTTLAVTSAGAVNLGTITGGSSFTSLNLSGTVGGDIATITTTAISFAFTGDSYAGVTSTTAGSAGGNTITLSNDTSLTTLTVNETGNLQFDISGFNGTAILTTESYTNSGAASTTLFVGTAGTTQTTLDAVALNGVNNLTLNGNVATYQTDSLAGVVTVNGVSDNAGVSFTHSAGTGADAITLGNGSNYINTASTGAVTVTTGTGLSTVVLAGVNTTGISTIVVGAHTSTGIGTQQVVSLAGGATDDSFVTAVIGGVALTNTTGLTVINAGTGTGGLANDLLTVTGHTAVGYATGSLVQIIATTATSLTTFEALVATQLGGNTSPTSTYVGTGLYNGAAATYVFQTNTGHAAATATASDAAVIITGIHTITSGAAGGFTLAS
ncbi:MAG: S-layer family protein [Methylococcales bacterium]|nr:MAG: S-layer family protein [Methylococcales bacterium]